MTRDAARTADASDNRNSSPRCLVACGFSLALIAITLVVYHRVVGFKLLTWDDDQHIIENEYFNPLSWSNLLHFWGYAYIYLYIPISYMFFGFEVWLSSLFPGS